MIDLHKLPLLVNSGLKYTILMLLSGRWLRSGGVVRSVKRVLVQWNYEGNLQLDEKKAFNIPSY
jgi:hypothetical protein